MFDNFLTCIDGNRQLLVMAFSHEKLTMSLFAQQTKENYDFITSYAMLQYIWSFCTILFDICWDIIE